VTGPAAWLRGPVWWLPYAAHVLPPLWLFAGILFEGRMLFFRDLSYYYFPNDVFLARAMGQGVWPLWNPTSDAGAPFLIAYPLDLLLVAVLGPRGAMAVGPPLHVWLAMCGATRLARSVGASAWGAWAAGLLYGASGFVLSSVNLRELFHAAAWAPWVVAAMLAAARAPSGAAIGMLAILAAVHLSTLSAEVVLQTALAGALLIQVRPRWRTLGGLLAAVAIAALLAAPVLLGVRALVEGTPRTQGLAPASAFAFSAHAPVLVEALLPRLFGNVHSFSEAGYWGRPFFPSGQPYLLSLYLGLGVFVLALAAGGGQGRWRWWLLAGLGVVLALGSHGPLAALLAPLMKTFRSPVKFAFLADLALCVLAGLGVDRVRQGPRGARAWALAPGAALCAAGLLLRWRPDFPARLLADVVPALEAEQARVVAAEVWPSAFLVSGALAAGAGLVLAFVPRRAPLAAALAGLDLLVVNHAINPAAEATFYELRPEVRRLVAPAAAQGAFRWFSYGVAGPPPPHWTLSAARHDSDVWLYYVDRQSLVPRAHVLDGLEGAFDEDRVGWSPPGSTFTVDERTPGRFRGVHSRLRLANVRWVLSFHPLPDDLVKLRGVVYLREIAEPLRLHELRDPLPRAFWVDRPEDLPPPAGVGGASVSYESVDPHTVRIRASTPPGYVVVLDGYNPSWRAEGAGGPIPLLRAHGRYWALPTPGGDQVITVRYAPPWRTPALVAAALGAMATLGLAVLPGPRAGRGGRGDP
jgi:hypothetical protein